MNSSGKRAKQERNKRAKDLTGTLTDFELEQYSRIQAGRQLEAVLARLQEARARRIVDPTVQMAPIERELLELILNEVFVTRRLVMQLMVSGGLVRAVGPEEAREMIERARGVEAGLEGEKADESL